MSPARIAARMSGSRRSAAGIPGLERLVLEFVQDDVVDQRGQPRDVDRAVAAVEVVLGELELLQQERSQAFGAARRHLQADRGAVVALAELALQRLAQVLDLLLVDPQVGVAGDAELRVVDDAAPREQRVQMGMDHRRQHHERVVVARYGDRQLHQSRQDPRRLDDRDRGLAAEGVVAGELDDEVEALVDDLRKGVRRVETDRRQQRPDVALVGAGDPVALGGGKVGPADQVDALARQGRQHLVVQQPVLLGDQRPDLDADLAQQRPRRRCRHAGGRVPAAQLFLDTGDPDLEELVEIAAEDAQEPQAFEQRDVAVRGQRQHAAIECEQRELAIQQRGGSFHRIGGGRRD